jgi:uncharacterized membrane protein YphA (DoxX/SURF4 family)
MNITLWIIQGILAIIFCMSGIMILTQRKEKLSGKMPFVNDYSAAMVKLVAFAHIIGAVGLIFPLLLNILPILTPFASCGLSVVMLLAIGYNKKRNDNKTLVVDVIFFLLFSFVAYGRFKGFK